VHIGSVSTGMKKWQRVPHYWLDSRRRYFIKNHGHAYAALATLARVAGAGVWGLKRALTGQAPQDPPRFIRDLVGHALRGGRKEA